MEISDLSDDVLIDILVRLPLESLGQQKSVSKSWNALISSKKFIDSHLNQSRIIRKPNVLVYEYGQIRMVEFSILGGEIMNIHDDFNCKTRWVFCFHELRDQWKVRQIVGSANGLLCVIISPEHEHDATCPSGENDDLDNCPVVSDFAFCLCNPLTKSIWDLPGNQWKRLFTDQSLFGFWYDDVNDDYKVVIINHVFERVGIHVYECQVYSLRSDSWRKVLSYLDFSFEYKFVAFEAWFKLALAGVLANGALHWIVLDDRLKPVSILAFDLRTFKFNMLPMPDDLGVYDRLKLIVLNTCLVLSHGYDNSDNGPLYDLWIMKDYGLNGSWMRLTINMSYVCWGPLTPVALSEERILIILITYRYSSYIQLIDLVSTQEWFIEIPCDFVCIQQVEVVGSLIQPCPAFVGYENVSLTALEDRYENNLGSVTRSELLTNDFDKFHIYVNGVSVDSQLPEHVQRKYYDLCCSSKSFLHERLVPDIPSKLAVSIIIEAVDIADFIRSCRFTTSKEEIEKWEKSLSFLELLGMNVGFLRDHIRRLLFLGFDSERGIKAKKYWEMKTKRSQVEDDIKDAERRLVELKEACKKYGNEVDERKPKAKSYALMFQEEANAPW